jgi:hypothetical protein
MVVEMVLIDLKYVLFESGSKWKRKKVLTDQYICQEEPMQL